MDRSDCCVCCGTASELRCYVVCNIILNIEHPIEIIKRGVIAMNIQSNIKRFDVTNCSDYQFLLFAKQMQRLAAEFYADKDNCKAYETWVKTENKR